LFSIFIQREVKEYSQLSEQLAQAEAEVANLKTPLMTVMVMQDHPKPRMTYVLDRGQYDLPLKERPLQPGVPGFLPEFGDNYQQNRLGMARWLTSPAHPLTSRVTVNRIWKTFFGSGIVESVEDFGLQGAWPSHPNLLDWLASDFVSNGWDTKYLIKTIVISQTCQQSSAVTANQLEIDPANRYLSRGPRFRLSNHLHTEAINHDPAITFINTGRQQPGKASMGAWLSYGLGSMNENLPAFVVMIPRGKGNLQAFYSRLWESGYLPSKHQGGKLRGGESPVLYLQDPLGIDRPMRRRMLDGLAKINQKHYEQFNDPETLTRISQYELAFRMQASMPELTDLSDEPKSTFELYGPDSEKPNIFARNCVVARRLAERGVRFIQLYHRAWDQHSNLPRDLRNQCLDVDQACAGLIKDLKQRGLFDDTLIVWGGEFGRTIYSQGKLTKTNHGRDHHGRAFTSWMAGAGVKRGCEFGKTDEYAYNIVENPVHIRDMNATILNQLGINHERLTFKFQGLDEKLTGVEKAHVIKDILQS